MKKDFSRGQGCNCEVMGEGNSPADHSHVSRTTPFQTKRKEIMADPQYQAEAMDKGREKFMTQRRRDKDVRPL